MGVLEREITITKIWSEQVLQSKVLPQESVIIPTGKLEINLYKADR
jgi:hypothetical protein